MRTSLFSLIVAIVIASLTRFASAQEPTIVLPPGMDATFGNDFGDVPTEPRRVQWLYASEYFVDFNGPVSITSLAWRPNERSGSITSIDEDFSLRLSTSPVSSLRMAYEQNVGDDVREVYHGALSIVSPANPSMEDFLLRVVFDEPFIYDPRVGDLLVDGVFEGFDQPWRVDNQELSGSAIRLVVGSPISSQGTYPWSILAAMQFTATAVPEPVSPCVTGIVFLAIAVGQRSRRGR
ncbi:MAG: hypothetical protein KDA92_23725 [Planctomycetales bacterium]|nr:hypothetical protein [Planctomycetales bacterium]